MSAIDEYLGELGAALRGPAAAKRDLLTEARDGLDDAAEAYREGGWTDDEAERRAVAEFGPIAVVAHGYQAELGMHTGVRTVWKLIVVVPLLQLAWDLARVLTWGDWSQLRTPSPDWYGLVPQFTRAVVIAAPLIGVLILVSTRWLGRRLDSARLARLCSVLCAIAVWLNAASVAVLVVATGLVDVDRLFLTVPCGILFAAWVAASVRLAVLARRSWGSCATIVA